ncbi:MAG: hypothetical protein QM752_01920 [Gammaproteobacteria bacterium]
MSDRESKREPQLPKSSSYTKILKDQQPSFTKEQELDFQIKYLENLQKIVKGSAEAKDQVKLEDLVEKSAQCFRHDGNKLYPPIAFEHFKDKLEDIALLYQGEEDKKEAKGQLKIVGNDVYYYDKREPDISQTKNDEMPEGTLKMRLTRLDATLKGTNHSTNISLQDKIVFDAVHVEAASGKAASGEAEFSQYVNNNLSEIFKGYEGKASPLTYDSTGKAVISEKLAGFVNRRLEELETQRAQMSSTVYRDENFKNFYQKIAAYPIRLNEQATDSKEITASIFCDSKEKANQVAATLQAQLKELGVAAVTVSAYQNNQHTLQFTLTEPSQTQSLREKWSKKDYTLNEGDGMSVKGADEVYSTINSTNKALEDRDHAFHLVWPMDEKQDWIIRTQDLSSVKEAQDCAERRNTALKGGRLDDAYQCIVVGKHVELQAKAGYENHLINWHFSQSEPLVPTLSSKQSQSKSTSSDEASWLSDHKYPVGVAVLTLATFGGMMFASQMAFNDPLKLLEMNAALPHLDMPIAGAVGIGMAAGVILLGLLAKLYECTRNNKADTTYTMLSKEERVAIVDETVSQGAKPR